MPLNELYEQISTLNRDDKMKIMKFIMDDLGMENLLTDYDAYKLRESSAAAHTLWEILQESQKADQDKHAPKN